MGAHGHTWENMGHMYIGKEASSNKVRIFYYL